MQEYLFSKTFLRHQRLLPLLILSWGLGMSSCDNGNGPVTVNCDYDMGVLLENVGDNIITRAYEEFRNHAGDLKFAIGKFTMEPGVANLELVRENWKQVYERYQSISVFEFGPATDSFGVFRERMNTFPANIQGIEDAIINKRLDLDNSFKSVVGLPAVEYLIFGQPGSDIDSLLAQYTTDPSGIDRRNYLSALSEDIYSKAEAIYLSWSPASGNYLNSFVKNSGNADGSSLSLLINEFNYDYEILKNYKFKIPLGRLNGGQVQPEKLEAYYGGISAELALAHANALYNLYLGKGIDGIDGEGFDDYLRCLETGGDTSDGLLADAIVEQFNTIITKLEMTNDPLSGELINDKSAVDEVYTEMQKLLPLIKREMTAAFGIKISYVDNDGD